jgi:hypothetical protein
MRQRRLACEGSGRGGDRADAYVFCVTDVSGATTRLVARRDVRRRPERGERVMLRAISDKAHLFRADTGERVVA